MNRVLNSKLMQAFMGLTAAFYGLSVFFLLFIRDRNRILFPGDHSHLFDWNLPYANLVPFHTIRSYLFHSDRYNYDIWFQVLFGNLILFFPFGVLVPLIIKRLRSFPLFFLILLVVLFGVEFAQKFTMTGQFDIDDIILNLIGGLTGFAAVRLFLYFNRD